MVATAIAISSFQRMLGRSERDPQTAIRVIGALVYDHPGEHVLLEKHQQSDETGEHQAVQKHETQNTPLVTDISGRGARDTNALRIDHLPHHAAGAVCGCHQYRAQTKSIGGDRLKAAEQHVRRCVAPRHGDT